ncbi:unnamed protein product [Calypogeia fissa]
MAFTGRKRRKDDNEFVADDDDGSDSGSAEVERKKPTETKKKQDSIKPEDGITVCELSKTRKVTVRAFKSTILVDIREFYSKNDGDLLPSKKGISLTKDQWNILRDHIEDVDAAISQLAS